MNIILITCWVSLALLWVVVLGGCLYDRGYEKREQEFQTKTFTFVVGGENALFVDNLSGGVVKVKIYNKKLVKFINP